MPPFPLHQIAGDLLPDVRIVDVGAMLSGDPIYQPLLDQRRGRVCGFEPVPAECERLNQTYGPTHRFLPYCLGDGEVRDFYVTNYSATSSLYEPNTRLLSRFRNLENLTRVVNTERVQTHRMDEVDELRDGVDYLKIDVQGAELSIFAHGERVLSEAVLIHTEVEFVPLYKEQPLFAEVDTFLRSRGFALHRFQSFGGRAFQPIYYSTEPNGILSQHLWADVLYVKDFMALERLPADKLLKLALILHEVYNSVDLCHLVLQTHDQLVGTGLAGAYLSRLIQPS